MDERDFIKEYKEMFDGIEARKELKDKILRQKPKRNKFRPIAAAIATTAAAVVIFAAVHDYDFKHDDSGVISTVTVSETEPPEQRKQTEQAPKVETETDNSEQTAATAAPAKKTARKNNFSSEPKNTAAPARPRITPEPYTEHRESSEAPAAKNPAPETPPEISSDTVPETVPETDHDGEDDERAARGSLTLPFRTGSVTLRMSAESVLTDIILQSMQQSEEPDITEEYHTEQWDNAKYFEYIGNDILNNISLGSDMVYIGDDYGYFTVNSSGKLKDDHRIFVFDGSGSRKVSILTSRDTSFVDAVLSSPEIDKKTVKDIEMTAFGTDLTYFFYIKSNDIAYIITTEGLGSEEIAELISSIN
ncbi:MAG: hypothetical protein J1G06_05470 [Oscillospiraceae bacterium]|nr:hypothetical protein [Oscillospiraceae bacterium]